jgi:AcrR family transcriptional regulator
MNMLHQLDLDDYLPLFRTIDFHAVSFTLFPISFYIEPMPPTFDKSLEERILRAAQRLLRIRGERGVTLRAVAAAAATTTPTVYKRFRNKDSLRLALAFRVRDQLNELLFASPSLREACREYLRFAEDRPNEYRLLFGLWDELFGSDRPRPGLEWARRELARQFGGQPADYERLSYALWLICHGAATLLTEPGDLRRRSEHVEQTLAICDALLQRGEILRENEAIPSS